MASMDDAQLGLASNADINEPSPKRPRAGTDTAPARLYSCGKCAKSYARLDHLSRHVRMRKLIPCSRLKMIDDTDDQVYRHAGKAISMPGLLEGVRKSVSGPSHYEIFVRNLSTSLF